MTEHYFEEHGMCYQINTFSPDRETLVFIHGVSGSLSAWKLYEERFKNSYNVLTYDIRGHGKSRKPRSYKEYSMPKFAEDLEALLEHLNIKKCILISHSYGTLIAFEFLHEHPERVSRAVFLSPSANPSRIFLVRVARPFIALCTYIASIFPFSERPGIQLDYSKFPDTTDWDIPIMWANIRNTTLHAYMYCMLQSYRFNAEPYLKEIHIPVLFMHGKYDTIFPLENAFFVHQNVSGSKLIVLNDIDHILVLNRYPEVSEAIEEFVSPRPINSVQHNISVL